MTLFVGRKSLGQEAELVGGHPGEDLPWIFHLAV